MLSPNKCRAHIFKAFPVARKRVGRISRRMLLNGIQTTLKETIVNTNRNRLR